MEEESSDGRVSSLSTLPVSTRHYAALGSATKKLDAQHSDRASSLRSASKILGKALSADHSACLTPDNLQVSSRTKSCPAQPQSIPAPATFQTPVGVVAPLARITQEPELGFDGASWAVRLQGHWFTEFEDSQLLCTECERIVKISELLTTVNMALPDANMNCSFNKESHGLVEIGADSVHFRILAGSLYAMYGNVQFKLVEGFSSQNHLTFGFNALNMIHCARPFDASAWKYYATANALSFGKNENREIGADGIDLESIILIYVQVLARNEENMSERDMLTTITTHFKEGQLYNRSR